MKIYTVPTTDGSFGIQEFNNGIMFVDVQCTGTSLATAAPVPTVETPRLLKELIIANYVDSSNLGIIFPAVVSPYAEIDIFAMGPNSVNVTVFLNSFQTLIDGSTSIDIPTGAGKKFRVIGDSGGGLGPKIIGVLG